MIPPLGHTCDKGHRGRVRPLFHSKEGMTQGDPLSMITYGIEILPLNRELRRAHLCVTQVWYADDAGAGGNFEHILAHLRYLQARGLPRGYYPELTKSILVRVLRNVAREEEFFLGMGIQVVTGHRYIRGFIGDREVEKRWLANKITGWAESVETLSGVSRKHPQSAYAGLQKSLQ